jgi:hypothetical protein
MAQRCIEQLGYGGPIDQRQVDREHDGVRGVEPGQRGGQGSNRPATGWLLPAPSDWLASRPLWTDDDATASFGRCSHNPIEQPGSGDDDLGFVRPVHPPPRPAGHDDQVVRGQRHRSPPRRYSS